MAEDRPAQQDRQTTTLVRSAGTCDLEAMRSVELELEEGEQLLWAGRTAAVGPQQALRAAMKSTLIVVLLAIVSLAACEMLLSGDALLFPLVAVFSFFGLAISSFWWSAAAFSLRQARSTVYFLTQERIAVLRLSPQGSAESYSLLDIGQVGWRETHPPDGTLTLQRPGAPVVLLPNVPQVREAHRIVRAARRALGPGRETDQRLPLPGAGPD